MIFGPAICIRTLCIWVCHPDRSAIKILPLLRNLWRGVEGSRQSLPSHAALRRSPETASGNGDGRGAIAVDGQTCFARGLGDRDKFTERTPWRSMLGGWDPSTPRHRILAQSTFPSRSGRDDSLHWFRNRMRLSRVPHFFFGTPRSHSRSSGCPARINAANSPSPWEVCHRPSLREPGCRRWNEHR